MRRVVRAFLTALAALGSVWLALLALSFTSRASPTTDPRVWDRRWAAALALLPERATQRGEASRALVDDDWMAGELAMAVLSRAPADGADVLREALGAQSARARERACVGLGSMGLQAASAVPGLILALRDDDAAVRASAAWALGRIGDAREAVTAALVERMDSDAVWVRREAVAALARASESPPAPILKRLAGPDSTQCAWALLVVTSMGARAEAAAPALARLAGRRGDTDLFRRTAAAIAAIGPGAATAVEPLLAHMREGSATEARLAGEALSAIGSAAVPGLLDVAVSGARGAMAAVSAIAAMGERATAPLAAALDGSDEGKRRIAASLLARRDRAPTVDPTATP